MKNSFRSLLKLETFILPHVLSFSHFSPRPSPSINLPECFRTNRFSSWWTASSKLGTWHNACPCYLTEQKNLTVDRESESLRVRECEWCWILGYLIDTFSWTWYWDLRPSTSLTLSFCFVIWSNRESGEKGTKLDLTSIFRLGLCSDFSRFCELHIQII